MITDITSTVPGALAMGIAAWAMRQVHVLSQEVAVLKKSDEFADKVIDEIKTEIKATGDRLDARISKLDTKVDTLTLTIAQMNGSDG